MTTSLALSLDELRRIPGLTPERFARHFAGFDFEFHASVQSHETFLKRKAGDCDDYATLAAAILKERGYTPRLIAVRMKRLVHVVCYIEEEKSYLDYDLRARPERSVVKSGNSLAAIAESVARRYGKRWSSVSEFTYGEGVKRLVQTVTPLKERPIVVAR